jgi:steroid 5-alpha reductase family enzyme
MFAWYCCYSADMILIQLRYKQKIKIQQFEEQYPNKPHSISKYVIPDSHGLFALTYTPNYLFEILQWIIYAFITQHSFSSWLFVFSTVSNLLPRAIKYAAFYRKLALSNDNQDENKKSN